MTEEKSNTNRKAEEIEDLAPEKTSTKGQRKATVRKPAARKTAPRRKTTAKTASVEAADAGGSKPSATPAEKPRPRKSAAGKATSATRVRKAAAKTAGSRDPGGDSSQLAAQNGSRVQDGMDMQGLCADAMIELPVGVAAFNADNILIFANQHFYEVFETGMDKARPGLSVEDMLRLVADERIFDDSENFESLLGDIQALDAGDVFEGTLQLRSGRRIGQRIKKLPNGSWITVLSDRTALTRAEEQAREAEYRWSFALESARQGVWDSNLVTGEMFYSRMWRVLRGLEDVPDEELNRRSWLDRLHPDDAEFVQDRIRRQNDGEVFQDGFTYRERHRDGHWIWILSRGKPVDWDADGKPSRIIGTDTDITEMRAAQDALAEAESRWNFALKGTGQGVWDADIRSKKMYYSPTWREMRGFGLEEEIDGDPEVWLERVHPDDRDRLRDIIEKQDRGEIPFNHFQYRERHRDGHYIWIQSRGKPVAWDADGNPTRTIGIDIDITTQKELELKVTESLRRLNTTLDNFPGGICMYDKDLVLTVANARYYEINDIDEHWFPVGSTMEDILRFHAEQGHYGPVDVDSYVAERLATARANQYSEFDITSDDGITIKYRTVPLDDGGFVMTFEDVTESLKAQQDRERLEQELVQAQRLESLGTLASGIAHEINTPIQYVGDNLRFIAQSLRDFLRVLQYCRKTMTVPVDPGFVAERAEGLHELEEELDLHFLLEELPLAIDQSAQGVAQVTRIVKAVKEFSHPGGDEMVAFDINAIIETTLIVSKNQWKYVAEVETDLDRSLPQVKCLPGELGQVILNLVVNAAQAIGAAERESGLIRVNTSRKDDFVVIEVTDNGSGIPEAIKDRIYDPFFTTKDIGEGTGQGLAIAFNAVVNKHKGTLECTSQEGEGTSFTIKLPIDDDVPQESEAA